MKPLPLGPIYQNMKVFSVKDLLMPLMIENSPNDVSRLYHLHVEYDDDDIAESCSRMVWPHEDQASTRLELPLL